MAEGKVTIMKLKADLHCSKCYKKVKKVLCNFPQIRDEVYDEKQGIVTIKVVCCNPEKLRDKLCCKGGGSIKSIEIVEPPKHKQPELEKHKHSAPPPAEAPTQPVCYPLPPATARVPIGTCCTSCDEGRPGGPCFQGYGGPPISYDGYYGGGGPCYVNRCECDQYFSEENPQGCTVM